MATKSHTLTLEQVTALASYDKNEVFWEFSADNPLTVAEVAKRLRKTRQTVHHHVNSLVAVNLLVPATTQKKRSRTETLYAWPFITFSHEGKGASAEYRRQSSKIFAATARRMTQEVEHLMDAAISQPDILKSSVFRHTHLILSPEKFAQLKELIDETDQKIHDLKNDENGDRFHVVLYVNPTLGTYTDD